MIALNRSRRLPGIRFEVQAPPSPGVLPRMDIAVFVGFAAAGPLHTPVPIASVARFLDVFGPDLPLARDPFTGLTRHAHLAPTVRAFFANGGRRCWVIRVADETQAERTRIGLPGLLRVSSSGALQPAMAAARSVGTWFDDLELRPSLAVRTVELAQVTAASPTGFSVTFTGTALRDLAIGDVIRLSSHREGEQGWVGFVPLLERETASPDTVTFTTGVAQWFFEVDGVSPPVGDAIKVTRYAASDFAASAPGDWQTTPHSGTLLSRVANSSGAQPRRAVGLQNLEEPEKLVGQWLGVAHATGSMWMYVRTAYADGQSGSDVAYLEGEMWHTGLIPNAAMLEDAQAWKAEVVTLDVQGQQPDRDPTELTGLGLTPNHRRAWTKLPSDEDRFAGETNSLMNPVPELWLESDTPRFPMVPAVAAHAEDWFIPLGLDTLGQKSVAWHSDRTDLEREGLAKFEPSLFLHEALTDASVDELADAAESIRLEANDALHPVILRGLHGA